MEAWPFGLCEGCCLNCPCRLFVPPELEARLTVVGSVDEFGGWVEIRPCLRRPGLGVDYVGVDERVRGRDVVIGLRPVGYRAGTR